MQTIAALTACNKEKKLDIEQVKTDLAKGTIVCRATILELVAAYEKLTAEKEILAVELKHVRQVAVLDSREERTIDTALVAAGVP